MQPPYKVSSTPERSRLQQGIEQLETVYESLHAYLYGRAEVPSWITLMSEFRAGIDWVRADAGSLDGGPLAA